MDNQEHTIERIGAAWDLPDGILYRVRQGDFDAGAADRLLQDIGALDRPGGESIDRRLVSSLWFMPLFLEWNRERVSERGGDMRAFESFRNKVFDLVVRILEVP